MQFTLAILKNPLGYFIRLFRHDEAQMPEGEYKNKQQVIRLATGT